MNWFKKLFGKTEETYYGLPEVKSIFPMPEVKPCKVDKPEPKKDISEPVYAIVKSMFDRPHTWKIKERKPIHYCYGFSFYDVKDITTGLEFPVTRYNGGYGTTFTISRLYWATEAEQEYIGTSLETMHNAIKMYRVRRIRDVKKAIERDKVKELYS